MIKENLKIEDINFINACLVNDETGTDEEIKKHLIKEIGISEELSREILNHRNGALLNPIDFDILDFIQDETR